MRHPGDKKIPKVKVKGKMPRTISERYYSNIHLARKISYPGEFIWAKVDLALANDITAPLAIEEFRKSGAKKVFNTRKIALVPDHFTPAKDLKSSNQARMLADFCPESGSRIILRERADGD